MTDAYILDIPRCSGHEAIQCDAGCSLIWKEAWLEKSDVPTTQLNVDVAAELEIATRLGRHNAKKGDKRFVCQATELWRASDPMSAFDPTQYVRERRGNKTPWGRIASDLATTASAKTSKLMSGRERVFGQQQSTPTTKACFEPEQAVRVKSRCEIESTLDRGGRNRGLWFDPEMLQFCGQVMRVSRVVKQVIDETTGELRVFRHPTIVLDDKSCTGAAHQFCSRAALFYWRSIWVEAADETPCGGCALANRRAAHPA